MKFLLAAVLPLTALLALGCNQTDKTGSTTTTTTTTTSTTSGSSEATPQGTNPQAANPQTATPQSAAPAGQEQTLAGGLKVLDEKVGDGDIAEAGKNVTVHYTGWLTDGTKFDSSLDRGQPFQFRLGAGNVIRGWDEGVKGMRVGGKRKLTIPSELGYGANGAPPAIPPNATLVFEVELLGVQ